MISMFLKLVATMHSANTMMPEDKLKKEIKLHSKSDCYSIWPTKKTIKKVLCNITRNLMKTQKINSPSPLSTT